MHFLNGNAEHETAGYSEDDECSSGEDHAGFCYKNVERPKRPLLVYSESQKPIPQSSVTAQTSTSSLKKLSSPQSQRPSQKRQSLGVKRLPIIHKSPATHYKAQPRPSSAGPQPSARPAHKASLQVLFVSRVVLSTPDDSSIQKNTLVRYAKVTVMT